MIAAVSESMPFFIKVTILKKPRFVKFNTIDELVSNW